MYGKKGKLAGHYKHGLTHNNKCMDCSKKIRLGFKRCHSCASKHNWQISKKLRNRDFNLDKNPNWNGGSSFEPYPLEFNDKLKLKIRNRVNHQCQNCGMTEEEHIIVYGQFLHVHHIDYNKKNCKENNLITTCNPCNTRANFNRDYWQKYFKEKINVCSISQNSVNRCDLC